MKSDWKRIFPFDEGREGGNPGYPDDWIAPRGIAAIRDFRRGHGWLRSVG